MTNADSICVFSGRNDSPDQPDPDNPGGVSQSFGQENRLGLIDPHINVENAQSLQDDRQQD